MRFLLFVPFAALAVACSSSGDVVSSDAGDAHADASAESSADGAADSSPDASPNDSGGACNALVNVAPLVTIDYVASAPPSPQGGTIADGTYTMTAAAIYTGTGGPTGHVGDSQVTIEITGSVIEVVSKAQPPNDHITTTIVTQGTTLTRTNTCPDTTSQSGTFTATPTSLTVILPAGTFPDGGTKTLVETFTKH